MFKNRSRTLFLAALFSLLNGCVTNPDTMPTYKFDSAIISNGSSNSIITSVISQEMLDKLEIPGETFWGWKDAYPPASINGKSTSHFAKNFAGMPIDGNFQVEVLSGVQKVGFYHANGNTEMREYIIEFNAEAGHKYYAKFLTPRDEKNFGMYRIKPIIYDLTLNKKVGHIFISDKK